jgi:hypothetical protein
MFQKLFFIIPQLDNLRRPSGAIRQNFKVIRGFRNIPGAAQIDGQLWDAPVIWR